MSNTEPGVKPDDNTQFITEKLYSPLFVQMVSEENEDYYDGDYWSDPISQQEAAYYEDEIHEAILRERRADEDPRGLMTYYDRNAAVDEKVHSLWVDVEVHAGKLWGVATLELTEPLTAEELDNLKDYLSGQYSDGFGEGFEQRGIEVGYGELYVSLWECKDKFFIAVITVVKKTFFDCNDFFHFNFTTKLNCYKSSSIMVNDIRKR